jgi:acyl-CoA reductase-like NAD-dependent aldehyde dehydrogenase
MGTLYNPRTGKPRGESYETSSVELGDAISRARNAAKTWAEKTPAERALALTHFTQALYVKRGVLADLECLGTGKPRSQALAEVEGAIDVIRFYAGAARVATAPSAGKYIDGYFSSVVLEPLGTIGVILPWNYPMMMLAWRLGPILAVGNTAVVKPAYETPETAVEVARVARCYLGEGIVEVVPGSDSVGKRLAVTRALDGLAFTGSVSAGYSVAAAAGIKPVSLELGGNGAAVVLPDAPLDTARILVDASTYNAGQSCASPARVIVVGKQADFVNALAREAQSRNATDFGPLISSEALNRVRSMVANTEYSIGARGAAPTDGYYFPATVLIDAVGEAVEKEVFGPVLTVERVDTVDDAIEKANSMPQALGCSIHTSSHTSALTLAPKINGGEVWVNCHLVQSPELPHSGRGSSGQGIDLSMDALRDFTRPKTITSRL